MNASKKRAAKLIAGSLAVLLVAGGTLTFFLSRFIADSRILKLTFGDGNILYRACDPIGMYQYADYVFIGTVTEFEPDKTFMPSDKMAVRYGFPYAVAAVHCDRVLKGEMDCDVEVMYPGGTLPIEEYIAGPHPPEGVQEDMEAYRKKYDYASMTSELSEKLKKERQYIFFCYPLPDDQPKRYLCPYANKYGVLEIFEDGRVYVPVYQKYQDLNEVLDALPKDAEPQ